MNNQKQKALKKEIAYTGGGILKLLVGLIVVFPIFYAFSMSFMSAAEITTPPPKIFPQSFANIENYLTIFTTTPMLRFLYNSLIMAIFGTLGRLITASTASFALCFLDFRGKKFLFFLILSSMMIPGDAIILTNYITVSKMGLVNTYLGLIIIYLVSASYVFMLRQSMLSIPRTLYEAAKIDGCSNFKFFIKMVLPLSTPILTTISLSSFVGIWNVYLWPLLITNADEMRTAQVGITMLNTAEQQSYGPIMAAACIALLPALIIFLISRQFIVRGLTAGAVKG